MVKLPDTAILKTEAAALMLSHFPVRKVTPFGLVGEACLCGVRFTEAFSFPEHVIALLEGEADA